MKIMRVFILGYMIIQCNVDGMILNLIMYVLQELVIQFRVLKFFLFLFVWGLLGVIVIVVNVIFLLLFKFMMGGKSLVLVFMRSICFVDVMIGLYVILKVIVFYFFEYMNVNCFLLDSIFIMVIIVFISLLVWLYFDCCLWFMYLLWYIFYMKKDNVVMGVVIMWNVFFVLGFFLFMGWNNVDVLCLYSDFYILEYVVFIFVLWCIGLFLNVFMEFIFKYYI